MRRASFLQKLYLLMFNYCHAFTKLKECLCDTPYVHPRKRAGSYYQNVQFLLLGQFLSNYRE